MLAPSLEELWQRREKQNPISFKAMVPEYSLLLPSLLPLNSIYTLVVYLVSCMKKYSRVTDFFQRPKYLWHENMTEEGH